MAILATALTTAFIPGASPPDVITPIRFFLPSFRGRGSEVTAGLMAGEAPETVWAMVWVFGGAVRFEEKG